jgi:hypothetical protein
VELAGAVGHGLGGDGGEDQIEAAGGAQSDEGGNADGGGACGAIERAVVWRAGDAGEEVEFEGFGGIEGVEVPAGTGVECEVGPDAQA